MRGRCCNICTGSTRACMNSRTGSVSDILRPMPQLSPTVSRLRQSLRLASGLVLLLAGLLIVALVFPLLKYRARMWAIRLWSRLFNRAMGLTIVHRGTLPPAEAALIVANHVSWIDIFVIDTWQPCRFVAKSEINHWPLIGWLCRHTGTLFISRQRRHDTGRIRHQMVHGLARGHCLGVFPEGTTSDGTTVLPFNPSLLQAALDTGVPVYSVSLSYRDEQGNISKAAPYIDDMNLLQSLALISGARHLRVEVSVAPPVQHGPAERRELAAHCRDLIIAGLGSSRSCVDQPP